MSKKSGWVGSKAYTRSECFTGSKAQSSERMPMGGSGGNEKRMSGKQVVSHDVGKHYSLEHASGALGGDKKTFSSGIPSEAPCNYKKHG